MENTQPGQVISPGPSTQPDARPPAAPEPEHQPDPAPESPAPTAPPESLTAQVPASESEAETTWQYKGESGDFDTSATPVAVPDWSQAAPTEESLSWTASEFIAHEKSAGWYALLAVVAMLGAVVIYILTKDRITTAIVVFAAILFGVLAARKPQVQSYQLNGYGLQAGSRNYPYQNYRSFSVAEESAVVSIVLMPLKRFLPPLTIYVAPDMEDKVLNFLSARLPFEQHKQDAVDSLLKRIRF